MLRSLWIKATHRDSFPELKGLSLNWELHRAQCPKGLVSFHTAQLPFPSLPEGWQGCLQCSIDLPSSSCESDSIAPYRGAVRQGGRGPQAGI